LSDFRIVYFEIDDPYKVTLLLQLGLLFPATPELLRELMMIGIREFGIFAVTPNGTVAGGHLLMHIRTETIEGGLEVGGVNAVATRPDIPNNQPFIGSLLIVQRSTAKPWTCTLFQIGTQNLISIGPPYTANLW